MKIGVEVELHSDDYNYEQICSGEGLSFNEFNTVNGSSIGVKMSREYYGHTIEYNFTPFEVNAENMKWIKDYLNTQIEKYGLRINSSNPSFVGTHVHIFDEEFLSINKPRLLKGVVTFINNKIDTLSNDSLNRLLFAHQLWGNWSWNNNQNWRKIIRENGHSVNYHDLSRDRPKNNPIIKSPATNSGKPESLEIRCIPNEFVFNTSLLDMMLKIRSGDINRQSNMISVMEFFCKIGTKIFRRFNPLRSESNNQTRIDYINSVSERVNLSDSIAIENNVPVVLNSQVNFIINRLMQICPMGVSDFSSSHIPSIFGFEYIDYEVASGIIESIDYGIELLREKHRDYENTLISPEFGWLSLNNAINETAYANELNNCIKLIKDKAGDFNHSHYEMIASGTGLYDIIQCSSPNLLNIYIHNFSREYSKQSIMRCILLGGLCINTDTVSIINDMYE